MRTKAPNSVTLKTSASSITAPGLYLSNGPVCQGSSHSCFTPRLTFFSSWLIAEDDGLDLVALVVEVGGVVDLDGPGEVGLVDHAVHALFDADEHAVIGERADLAADLVARLVLVGERGSTDRARVA